MYQKHYFTTEDIERTSMMLSKYKKEYKKNGIVVIPNVFTEEECVKMKEEAYRVRDKDITKAGYPHQPSEQAYNKRSLIFFPALANEYLNKIRTDERMVKIARYFIDDDIKQINNQIYFREAGDQDQFAWHKDIIFREPRNFNHDVVGDYFQTIIAVDDITEDNGAIEFIPKSWDTPLDAPKNLRVFNRNGLEGSKLTCKRGSVLIWGVDIIHGSEPNTSDSDRMTYMNGWCRSKATRTYPDYLVGGKVVEKINPRQIP